MIASEARQHEVATLVRLLDGTGGGKDVAVVPLLSLDPHWAANTLNNMFQAEGTSAPVIQVDPLGQHLVVRGTNDHLLQVKGLIVQMSQTSASTSLVPGYNSGPVRQIPLQGQDPSQLLPMLERLWNASHGTPLRIVRPGAAESNDRPARPATGSTRAGSQEDSVQQPSRRSFPVEPQTSGDQTTLLFQMLNSNTFPVMFQPSENSSENSNAGSDSSENFASQPALENEATQSPGGASQPLQSP